MSRSPRRSQNRTAFAAVALLLTAAFCTPVQGQDRGAGSRLEEEQRVTAVDVLVELDADRGEGRVVPLPRDLRLEDFAVEIEGELRPVIGFRDPRVADPGRAREPAEPWRIVLYFDLELAQRDTVRWAASELAELVPRLVDLGEVELVVTGDGEHRGLAPTRDAELLQSELAGLAIKPGGVHSLLEIRGEVLKAFHADPAALEQEGIVDALVEQEVALVERRLDDLLLHLVDGDAPGRRRALFWVADGFDFEPEAFYRSQGFEVGRNPASLRDRAAKLSVTMASYGWVGIALSPPLPDAGLVPGFRIGKWLVSRGTAAGLMRGELVFLRLTREERRDPETAAAHYDIGQSQMAAGKPEDAEQAFELALYHYAGDPRTAKEQAAAKAGLGRALEAQGSAAEARQAFRHAVELDPELAAELPQSRPRLLEPLAFQEALAVASSGRLVETPDGLVEAVESLSRRARLTYQLSGVPKGEVRKLAVSLTDADLALRYPVWTRFGTPSGVAAARARRLSAEDYEDGELAVRARPVRDGAEGSVVVVRLDPESLGPRAERTAPVVLRITTASGEPDGVQDVRYKRFEVEPGADESAWTFRLPIGAIGYEGWTSVIVEDLETGRWGADMAD